MSQTQHQTNWMTIGLCYAAVIMEGIDIQSIGVAAPRIAPEYGLNPGQMGFLFIASTLGLITGGLLGGRIADHIGRKWVLVAAVSLFGLFSITTPFAWDYVSLCATRFLTGIGLGAGFPMLILLVAEASPPDKRTGMVTMLYSGTPLGGMLVSALPLTQYGAEDWRFIFYVGGLAPLVLAPLIALLMKESVAFESSKAVTSEAHEAHKAQATETIRSALFGHGRAPTTLLLSASFFFTLLVLYLLLNWLPSLLVSKGFEKAQASQVQLAFNLGGVLGAFLFGFLISGKQRMMPLLAYVGIAAGLLGLSMISVNMSAALASGFIVGLFTNPAPFMLYGLSAVYYETAVRGTGVGTSLSVGRLGSITGPLMVGAMLTGGLSASGVLMWILPIVAAGGVSVFFLLKRPRVSD